MVLAAADAAFRLADWHDFAVMLGGAAAALTGLVFVAVSIQLRTVAASPVLRRRATSSLLFLFTIVAGSAAILAPQSPRAVGVEFLFLVLIGLFAGRPGLLDARKQTNRMDKFLLAIRTPAGILYFLADVSLVAERGYGMYVAAPCMVVALGITVGSAWVVLVAAIEETNSPG